MKTLSNTELYNIKWFALEKTIIKKARLILCLEGKQHQTQNSAMSKTE